VRTVPRPRNLRRGLVAIAGGGLAATLAVWALARPAGLGRSEPAANAPPDVVAPGPRATAPVPSRLAATTAAARGSAEPLRAAVNGGAAALLAAAAAARHQGDLRATLSLLETAVARAPTVETHGALGALYLELGAAGAAEAQLRVAAEGDPGSADRWIALANALALKPDPLAAADALERARSAEPGLHVTRDPAGRLMRQPSPPAH